MTDPAEMGAGSGAPAEAAPPPKHAYWFLGFHTTLWLVADLASKEWATLTLAGYDPGTLTAKKVVVWAGHAQLIYAQNPGGAWSFLRSLPDVVRRPFFLFVSAAAIVFIVTVYARVHHEQRALKWGLPLALGGAMGNLADRIRYGWVVDFIDLFATRGGREYHWPTFNVADIAIVIGVGLMAIDMLVGAKRAVTAEHPRPVERAGEAG